MIEVHAGTPGCGLTRLVLRPPRALSGRQVGALFALLSGTMWVVALLGAAFGNVFAPPFALLHSLIVAAALRWMWRLGERREQIDVDGTTICVRRMPRATDGDAPVFQAHPYLVRLRLAQAGREPHVVLGVRDQQVEVGGFLAPDERRELAEKLQHALLAVSGRGGRDLERQAPCHP
ncbi:MAG: DUF2244 domain-containing protein [Proteobacteria bacterium]|nr:DUF2244 domain-containing protein [Pseudomonadota bacterium]